MVGLPSERSGGLEGARASSPPSSPHMALREDRRADRSRRCDPSRQCDALEAHRRAVARVQGSIGLDPRSPWRSSRGPARSPPMPAPFLIAAAERERAQQSTAYTAALTGGIALPNRGGADLAGEMTPRADGPMPSDGGIALPNRGGADFAGEMAPRADGPMPSGWERQTARYAEVGASSSSRWARGGRARAPWNQRFVFNDARWGREARGVRACKAVGREARTDGPPVAGRELGRELGDGHEPSRQPSQPPRDGQLHPPSGQEMGSASRQAVRRAASASQLRRYPNVAGAALIADGMPWDHGCLTHSAPRYQVRALPHLGSNLGSPRLEPPLTYRVSALHLSSNLGSPHPLLLI